MRAGTSLLLCSLLAAGAPLCAQGPRGLPPWEDEDVPPAPLPDLGDPKPAPDPANLPNGKTVRSLDAVQQAAVRSAVARQISHQRAGSRDDTYPIHDPHSRRNLRLTPEAGGMEVFPAAEGAVARAHFKAKDGVRVVLDFPMTRTRSGWQAGEPRIWKVGDQMRYHYDAAGRVVETLPPPPSPPWWLKFFPWLKKE